MSEPTVDAIAADEPGSSGPRRVAPFVALAALLVFGALFWILANADSSPNQTADSPLLGRPAPDAVGSFADGRSFDLSRRKGSWVVLNFFTSTCVPCIREHPELITFVDQQRSLGIDGAEFYTIVQHDDAEAVDEFFAERGGDWPVVYDEEFEFQNDFGVAQVPETWIIDPTGTVRARIISEVTAEELSVGLQRLRDGGDGS